MKNSSLKKTSFNMMSLALGSVTFLVSSLYLRNGFLKLNFVIYPQMAIYIILGFFHAYNVWKLDAVIEKKEQGVFSLFCYFLVYTAWYNVVLLPESGLGYIEWGIVFIAMISNFITELTSKKINNPFMGQRPLILVFLGICLFIVKFFFFFMFKDNIYDQMILQNSFARFLVVIFSGIGLVLLLMQFSKHITNRFNIKVNKEGIKASLKRFFNFIVAMIKKGIQLLLSIVCLPVFIIIVASAVLIFLGIGFATMNWIYTDILKFIEPIAEKLTSIGENSIHPSKTYYVLQIVSIVMVLFYTIKLENVMSKKIQNNIELNIREETDSLGIEDEEAVFENAKKLLVDNSRFDDQLRILASRTCVKETVLSIKRNTMEEK